MPRYRITIEYDGTSFTGWQVQPHAASIQGCSSGGTACWVICPPIQSVGSVITTVLPFRNAA